METPVTPVTPFLAGKMPKEKYDAAQEFAEDLAKILAISPELISVPLISLPDLKGDKGDKGDKGNKGNTGAKGDTGGTGPTGSTGPGLTWMGTWTLAIGYVVNDLVENSGATYICTVLHTADAAKEPGTGVDWADYWELFPFNILTGTATNDDAAVGDIGEYVESVVLFASAITLTDSVDVDVTSISLTAGDWDVEGHITFISAAGTVTQEAAGISTTTATQPVSAMRGFSGVQEVAASYSDTVVAPRTRISIAGTTTVFLVSTCVFSAGTLKAFGALYARRIR